MPSLNDIKRRISSVKSTQKITRAMKMVAASKLRRAQQAIVRTRPYAYRLRDLVGSVAARADAVSHPLLRTATGEGKVGLVVVTSDRGLCGGFNAAIVNRTLACLKKDFAKREVELTVVGRKGIESLRRRPCTIRASFTGASDKPAIRAAAEVIDDVVADFMAGGTDAVYCVYNEFKSAVQQDVVVEQVLPIAAEPFEGEGLPLDYLYEPDQEAVFGELLVRYTHVQMHRILHESLASEYGARMTAMDSATRNAGDVIDRLTLQYNRARQDAITTQLIEVVSGAEAL